MPKAIVPESFPLPLPAAQTGWARSTKRAGTMFHLHALGFAACRSIRLERHESSEPESLGDLRYFGVCPRCYRIAQKESGRAFQR